MKKPTPIVLEYIAANPNASADDLEKLKASEGLELKRGTISSLKSHALIVLRELKRLRLLRDDYADQIPDA